jgi:hypothetical protein
VSSSTSKYAFEIDHCFKRKVSENEQVRTSTSKSVKVSRTEEVINFTHQSVEVPKTEQDNCL